MRNIFHFELNRRTPNGIYGGVRGERKSPLLDDQWGIKTKNTVELLQLRLCFVNLITIKYIINCIVNKK